MLTTAYIGKITPKDSGPTGDVSSFNAVLIEKRAPSVEVI
jgi:hypothetical protein